MKPFDIFLVCAYKDLNKLPFVLEGVSQNIKGYEEIWVCTPSALSMEDTDKIHFPVHYITDHEVIQFQANRWKHRPSWIAQMFIKLFQNVTKNDWYFVCDCDTLILRHLQLWNGEHPIQYYGWDQNNQPYYEFNKKVLGYDRVLDHTTLSDTGHYNKKLINEMLDVIGYQSPKQFIHKTYNLINDRCYPSETDLHFNWVAKHYPTLYEFRRLKTKMNAREGNDPFLQLWSEEDIKSLLAKMRTSDIDTTSIHSWIDKSHNRWGAK